MSWITQVKVLSNFLVLKNQEKINCFYVITKVEKKLSVSPD